MTSFPFATLNDLCDWLSDLPGRDDGARLAAQARQNSLTKPAGSLGRLEDLALFMAGWQGREKPCLDQPLTVVFAGNHGVCAQGINPYPVDVTAQMVANFRSGGAAINQLCRLAGAKLSVVTLDLDRPTGDFTVVPALGEADVLAAMAEGWQSVDPQASVFLPGEMGIGNSTVAAALAMALFGGDASDWVGPGTGADDGIMARKRQVVSLGVERHKGLSASGFGPLLAFGGREQAAIVGAILAARQHRIPVILDGFIVCAAAAILTRFPAVLDHCIAGHVGAEPGHARLLAAMGKSPLLDLGMRLGEGSGAAVALLILQAALATHNGMASFAEAGVSDK